MNVLVPITLFGWIPFVVLLFAVLPTRRAVLAAYLIAWLFLPVAGYSIPGLPDYTKVTASSLGVLLGTVIFDPMRVIRFRPKWVDLPMIVWCVCPFISSIVNGLGAYDGISTAVHKTVMWGFPYFIGRLFFSDLEGAKELAAAIVVGGLIYVPLCLLEIRLSPQLHTWVYGFHQHTFGQTKRLGGWRPTVFMQHGLMVGMWMCMSSMVGIWLWRTGAVSWLKGEKGAWVAAVHAVTAVLCKSVGALGLMVVGLAVLFLSQRMRSRLPMMALLCLPPAYMVSRGTGVWEGEGLVQVAGAVAGGDREQSLAFRFENEDMLIRRAVQQWAFGWGGWGRNLMIDHGKVLSVPDGLWVIVLGQNGVVGLLAISGLLLVPGALLCSRIGPHLWANPRVAPVVALAAVSALYMVDNLLNAMLNPIFMMAAGAVGGIAARWPRHLTVLPPDRAEVSSARAFATTDGNPTTATAPANAIRASAKVRISRAWRGE